MDEIKGMAFPPAILEKLRDGNEAQEPQRKTTESSFREQNQGIC
jgi:hypothetical protein